MIRFTYQGAQTDQDVPADGNSVAVAAATLAGWGEGVTVRAQQTSPTTWTFTAEGETVTAEVIDA